MTTTAKDTSTNNCIFKSNYFNELPEDIRQLIYTHVYKNNYSVVLKELRANIENQRHYNNLKHFLVYQEEPKLNLLNYLSQSSCIRKYICARKYRDDTLLSLYKKHLTSGIVSVCNKNTHMDIRKLKIPTNIFKYLDKIIAKTFINFMKKSTQSWDISYNIYIDDAGEYFVLEYDRHFICFADLYLMLLSFWQYIRMRLYEFYELHKEAYNRYIYNLLKNDYETGIYMWLGGNITDDILDEKLVKMKGENPTFYRKITRQRNNIAKTESLYINFEIRNNIDSYRIDNDTIIMRLKEM
jgi:hypothetical protein